MLRLRNITKTYVVGEEKIEALKGVSISFRESEFVSILGASGCGKTTLLNIIGGLDRYTTGDLVINGKSTKSFKDRDWDAYRNHSIGFVFQSYNLISHQSVLSNVELSLTIAGISKSERRKRAIEALEEVGLKDQLHKKPNQLSGGQMQRVAIARALVNDPDIILADEPTGALDSKTSVQIMEILKRIAKDRLIIMVTHNKELAETYSSRIIRIFDGQITDDSNPIENENTALESFHLKRTSMKLWTSFKLSMNNLMTKKTRTILTAFAGSIGIIGIALILAISTGIQNYIDKLEEDTLSSYPLTIENSTVDISSMMDVMMGNTKKIENKKRGRIYSSDIMNEMMSTLSSKVETNNLKELKRYIEKEENDIKRNSNAISYSYNLDLHLYKEDTQDGIVQVNPSTVLDSMGMGEMMEAQQNTLLSMGGSSSNSFLTRTSVWNELLDNPKLLKSQYDLISGKWPSKYNEVVLIVSEDNEISDYTLYALGLKDQTELKEKMDKIKKGEEIEKSKTTSYKYDELVGLSYKILLNSDYYQKENGIWLDKSDDEVYMKKKIESAQEIKVVGIIRPNPQSVSMGVGGVIGYTKDLKEYVIQKSNESEIAKEQAKRKDINVFSGLKFPSEDDKNFDYQNLTDEQKLAMSQLTSEQIADLMKAYTENKDATYEKNLQKMGAIDLNDPTSINIYPKDFDAKENITKAIEEYNDMNKKQGKEENVINYTDVVQTMMKSVNQIIDIISYVLIAFVAISLIVSSIMIGIITYISVLERTKEIGILRAIGASKKDISRVFNAETIIVGLISGIIGIGVTVLLTFPINHVIYDLTNVVIQSKVPLIAAIILILLSVFLTAIAGLIPARIASKKDPVIALRTE